MAEAAKTPMQELQDMFGQLPVPAEWLDEQTINFVHVMQERAAARGASFEDVADTWVRDTLDEFAVAARRKVEEDDGLVVLSMVKLSLRKRISFESALEHWTRGAFRDFFSADINKKLAIAMPAFRANVERLVQITDLSFEDAAKAWMHSVMQNRTDENCHTPSGVLMCTYENGREWTDRNWLIVVHMRAVATSEDATLAAPLDVSLREWAARARPQFAKIMAARASRNGTTVAAETAKWAGAKGGGKKID